MSSAGDRANSQLAVKQAELAVRQAEIVLSPAQAVLLAAQGEIDSLREVNALTAEANQDAIDDAQVRVSRHRSELSRSIDPGQEQNAQPGGHSGRGRSVAAPSRT